MFIYPQEVLSSANSALVLWWSYVLPALLPFFILSELLMAAGFVHFLGILLESIMRPVFGLPGKAAFVVAMGYTSGFPMGAVLTARLRQAGEISRVEGERLLAFTNNPSPGFMFGAVASGMLGQPGLGLIIAGSVYLSNIIVGCLFRFYQFSSNTHQPATFPSLKRAWEEILKAQRSDNRAFGQILSDAIKQSTTTVLMVAGFMAFFSVVLRLLNLWHILSFLAAFIHYLLPLVPLSLLQGFLNGLFEMTLGCRESIQAVSVLHQQIALITLLMGWSGLSVFAQVAGFISSTDLRILPFVTARILHGILALGLSQLFLFISHIPTSSILIRPSNTWGIQWNTWHLSSLIFIGNLSLFVTLAFLRIVFFRPNPR
jgi:sporulation integral membrane protein YlbJ